MTPGETAVEFRVRYAETDQMGVVHHANYLIWCEYGRTQHLEQLGLRYRDLEGQGVRLPVIDARLKYRSAARYDDLVRVRSWVRNHTSRTIQFGSVIEDVPSARLLATATITLVAVNADHAVTTIPPAVRSRLRAQQDPVRL